MPEKSVIFESICSIFKSQSSIAEKKKSIFVSFDLVCLEHRHHAAGKIDVIGLMMFDCLLFTHTHTHTHTHTCNLDVTSVAFCSRFCVSRRFYCSVNQKTTNKQNKQKPRPKADNSVLVSLNHSCCVFLVPVKTRRQFVLFYPKISQTRTNALQFCMMVSRR
jgi:hypothetical protein